MKLKDVKKKLMTDKEFVRISSKPTVDDLFEGINLSKRQKLLLARNEIEHWKEFIKMVEGE